MTNSIQSYIVIIMDFQKEHVAIIVQKLKEAKMRITPQRVAILGELADNQEHPTADAVYKKIRRKFPNISFDTVNRTLISFAQGGVVKVAEWRGGARRYDPMTEPHHHFHCVRCSRIIDFMDEEYDKIKLPESIIRKHQVLDKKIVLDGVCQDCSNRRTTKVEKNKKPTDRKEVLLKRKTF